MLKPDHFTVHDWRLLPRHPRTARVAGTDTRSLLGLALDSIEMAAVTPIRSRSRSPPEHAAPARVCRAGIRRRYRGCMSALTEYIDAWVVGDAERIAATVAEDCVITEC